jgi:hypothetical protein
MSELPFPEDDHSAFDYVLINGGYFVCGSDFPKAEKGRKLDAKSAAGSDGGRIVDKGYDLAKITITLKFWKREHFELWNTVVPELIPRPGRNRAVVRVRHPALEMLNIEDVVIEKIGSLEHSGKGLYTLKITAIEYHPATTTNATQTPGRAANGQTEQQLPPAILNTNARGALDDSSLGVGNPTVPVSPRVNGAQP